MIVLKNLKVDNSKSISTELLVIGRFKDTNIEKCLSFLGKDDRDRILDTVSLDMSNGEIGNYLLVAGDSKIKRIVFFNLGDKKKIRGEKIDNINVFLLEKGKVRIIDKKILYIVESLV